MKLPSSFGVWSTRGASSNQPHTADWPLLPLGIIEVSCHVRIGVLMVQQIMTYGVVLDAAYGNEGEESHRQGEGANSSKHFEHRVL